MSDLDERPPLLGSWTAIYLVVAGSLAAVIVLLWLFSKAYA